MAQRNTLLRAKLVQDIMNKHYEPGRQDRCKLWVLRNIIRNTYPLSDRTLFRYLKMDTSQIEMKPKKPSPFKQLDLFE